MPWSGDAGPATPLMVFSYNFDSLASAAASGVPILEWPHPFRGRVVAIEVGADARSVASDVLARFRRFDASASTTNFMVNAGKTIPADDFTRIDSADTNTVQAEELLDAGDRILFDKNNGGSLTRGTVNVHVAHG